MLALICSYVIVMIVTQAHVSATSSIDKGDHILVCSQEPIELGIVLDSSSSIKGQDFASGITFLENFLQQYEIGAGQNDVRVSSITFGKGIYPQDAFNLTTYNSKKEVIGAIGKIPHRSGLHTDTGEAIAYMSKAQLDTAVTRPAADRISIVITDGNSQEWRKTKAAAKEARDSGILMFVVGVGNVRQKELINIAGDEARIFRVDNYDELETIKTSLARQTCFKKDKPSTTPMPHTSCGEESPADIYFVYSLAELGTSGTAWASSLVSSTVSNDALEDGFRFGVVSGSCPDDEGFDLDDYSTAEDIITRVRSHRKGQMSKLVKRLAGSGYTAASGGRDNTRNIAVLVAGAGKRAKQLDNEVATLVAMGVEVFIADRRNSGIKIDGAVTLKGRGSRAVSVDLVSYLCNERTDTV